ncbi:DUF512 domain-containing protein [Carboxydothermus hydrogenoformans]|uniref:PDZ domain-containing protein n=1 Tax=Carboxydothermus hydrogenoformans (strain ATCC BAA-161 / DSM 6008 / Z-2901) TaxID=246194 RepID=Q3AAU5_CARHZ|nr:DUF512 domain-containing protein [Carboxydothermus hydrogenoformans]ABB14059.1 conserved hypothetical protein [Carboxydothermus hydrogenoformans Z-2901]
MVKIVEVIPESLAYKFGINPGDELLEINGQKLLDYIQYKTLTLKKSYTLKIKEKNGKIRKIKVKNSGLEDLGLIFESSVFDGIRECENHCLFCFVRQLPPGMRESLYVRDDDYRLSFLHGNYITLTNLTDADFQRIIKERLSPLYISVHATDPKIRGLLLGNKKAGDILEKLELLAQNGIAFHLQLVLVPGINDGEVLEKSLTDLIKFFPAVQSIALVPVGLTRFRKNKKLRRFTKEEAIAVVDLALKYGRRLKKELGTRLIYPSDEFFLLAEKKIPGREFYEGFPQYENGVGIVRDFVDKMKRVLKRLPEKVIPQKVGLITGILGGKILAPLVERLNDIPGLNITLLPLENGLFGPEVTVAGLLTGHDILREVEPKSFDYLVIPDIMVKEGDNRFLDDLTVNEVALKLKMPVYPVLTPQELLAVIKQFGR